MTERVGDLRQAIRSPWALLILFGLFCQGYSWDNMVMPFVYIGLWAIAITLSSDTWRIPERVEALILVVAIFGFFQMGLSRGINRFVFIGNALVVMQLLLLLRPTTVREKKWAVGVAIVHMAIGTQLVVDYEFNIVLFAFIVLLPRTLFDLEATYYRKYVTAAKIGPNWRHYRAIAVLMALFFLLLPKPDVATPMPRGRLNVPGPGPMPDTLDPSEGGADSGDRMIFRIAGDDIDYVKIAALDTFDGQIWSMSTWAQQSKSARYRGTPKPRSESRMREVKIESSAMLPNLLLPVDGSVQDVEDIPYRVSIMDNGGMAVPRQLDNFTYRYWSIPYDPDERLRESDRRRYLALLDPPSAELTQLVQTIVGDETDPMRAANLLTTYFHNNFTYNLGAPDLSRTQPIDDFVFNSKEGHCERFGSALAVMLRIQGIPSRVGIGYMAAEQNTFADFYNIRARHGHAWTEAFIPGRGWIIFDATPVGSEGIPRERSSLGLSIFEWIEYVWYSKIVEFDSTTQTQIWDWVGNSVGTVTQFALSNFSVVLIIIVGLACIPFLRRINWRRLLGLVKLPPRDEQIRVAQYFYGAMLRQLARDRYLRPKGMTPLEFLAWLETENHPGVDELRLVTQTFCNVRYGDAVLDEDRKVAVDQALARLRRQRHPRPRQD